MTGKSNRNVLKKLKSAASVMQSSLMGFGFGTAPERNEDITASEKRYSISLILFFF